MKVILLTRHAEAIFNRNINDFDRKISLNGKKQAEILSNFVKRAFKIDLIFSSTSLRTTQTAKIINQTYQDSIETKESKKLYLATAGEILKEVANIENKHNVIMLLCHNPGLQNLMNFLHQSPTSNQFTPASMAIFESNVEKWSDLAPKNCKLLDFFANSS